MDLGQPSWGCCQLPDPLNHQTVLGYSDIPSPGTGQQGTSAHPTESSMSNARVKVCLRRGCRTSGGGAVVVHVCRMCCLGPRGGGGSCHSLASPERRGGICVGGLPGALSGQRLLGARGAAGLRGSRSRGLRTPCVLQSWGGPAELR